MKPKVCVDLLVRPENSNYEPFLKITLYFYFITYICEPTTFWTVYFIVWLSKDFLEENYQPFLDNRYNHCETKYSNYMKDFCTESKFVKVCTPLQYTSLQVKH